MDDMTMLSKVPFAFHVYDMPFSEGLCSPQSRRKAWFARASISAQVDPDVVEASDELNKVRKTKMVCTIGPTSCSRENLFRLAEEVDS